MKLNTFPFPRCDLPSVNDTIRVDHWHHLEHKLIPQGLGNRVVTHQMLKDSCIVKM